MELIESKYIVECTPGGEYYAYLADYNQCCAYGETRFFADTKKAIPKFI